MNKIPSELSFPGTVGEMAERLRNFDWSQHPLGPPENWPQSLKVVIQIMLTSRYAMWLGWGKELYFFCNDAYLPTLGIKRDFLGTPANKVWAEIWEHTGPRAESVVKTGKATWDEGLLLFLERSGFAEETYHTFSYSPVPTDSGEIGGMLCVVTEETTRVIGERRLATLRDLAADTDAIRAEPELFLTIERLIERHSKDTPFTALYLFEDHTEEARLAAATGIKGNSAMAPQVINASDPSAQWSARQILQKQGLIRIPNLGESCVEIPTLPWDKPAKEAVVVPLLQQGQERPAGFFVAGINPYRSFDGAYQSFIELLAGQIGAALSNVRAYQSERRRAEALAELDRAKTTFFSNISHELRTPLTLMLGPLEEELQNDGASKEGLRLAHRNTLRLLKLVNSLLDFSRLEAGRIEARYQPTDLGSFSAELASVFRSAMEKAGLRFTVHCPTISEQAYVDREMWEKIVLNLLSNAFKFTFQGEVSISVQVVGEFFELAVKDTGAGIPAAQMNNLFERFHRIRSTRSRSIEGTGIGLALVKELASLHGGSVQVESVEGSGSTFKVLIRRGRSHLPQNRVEESDHSRSSPFATAAFVNEATRWLPEQPNEGATFPRSSPLVDTERDLPMRNAKILVADDNADMREYVARLLGSAYSVTTVSNGAQALIKIKENPPDLVLSDVMMPEVDGFELLQTLRGDESTRQIPVVMLSARAGEEARIDGLQAGANDYLIKPFSARELLARVSSQLEINALRKEGEDRVNRILESITDAFMVLDKDWRIAKLNEAAKRNFERFLLNPEHLLGKNHWEVFPDSVGGPVEKAFRRAAEAKAPAEFEHFYAPWNRWFSVRAFPLRDGGISVFYQDVTEAKLAGERIRRSEEQLRLLTDTLPALIAYLDRNLVYRFNNRRYEDWFGAPDISGRHVAETIDHETAREREPYMRRALEGIPQQFESVTVHRTLGPRHTDVAYVPDISTEGEVRGFYVFVVDIHDLKQTQIELERTRATLEETVAQRTAKLQETIGELEAFSYSVSHDMRSPLRAMEGFSKALLEDYSDKLDDEGKNLLRRIEKGARRLDMLIQDVLAYSRVAKGSFQLRAVNLQSLIDETIQNFEFQPAAIKVVNPLPIVMAHEALLSQILSNLLGNAVKFARSDVRPEIRISAEPDGARVRISIADNGIGIDSSHFQRIFEIFGRVYADKLYSGTGIGLAIVKKAVERLGGKVGVASTPGQGSTFWFTLAPAAQSSG